MRLGVLLRARPLEDEDALRERLALLRVLDDRLAVARFAGARLAGARLAGERLLLAGLDRLLDRFGVALLCLLSAISEFPLDS